MYLAKVGDKVVCPCEGGPHRIVSGASTAKVDGIPVARIGDKSSCGAAITSGVSWYSVEGAPAAIHGSATTCGGCVEAASSLIISSPTTAAGLKAGAAINDVSGSERDAFMYALAENKPETVYKYVVEETEVIIKQTAYLLVEGVGINGGYSFRNHIVIRENILHVSSQGWAPSTQSPGSGSAVFSMRAELIDSTQLLEAAVLNNSGINMWPDDPRYIPIGHATLRLPEPQPGRTLSLRLQGTFIYQTSSGSVSPMPPSTSRTISIQVEAQ